MELAQSRLFFTQLHTNINLFLLLISLPQIENESLTRETHTPPLFLAARIDQFQRFILSGDGLQEIHANAHTCCS
jgi:hypothetical protein